MSIDALSSATPSYQPVKTAGRDNDGDEATETAATKAQEAKVAPGLPVDTALGRNLNVVA